MVGGVRISHPDRVVYPDVGLTKYDVARYYESVAQWILPHVKGRPLTLVHCPDGLNGSCHYLRHAKAWGPSALRRVRIREQKKIGEYLVADSQEAVVSLAQMGVLEVHTWNSTTDHLEQPSRIIWDLDPGPQVEWSEVVRGARLLRSVLDLLGLQTWVKTTGGAGLHVVLPIAPSREWSWCLEFSRAVAASIERSEPDAFTTAFAKHGREDKILIDYLRNNRTNTSVAAFSTRARAGAPVSTPVSWEEIARGRPSFTVATLRQRMARRRSDPWSGYWQCRQRIAERSLRAVQRM
ncbi:MAG TPA: non-homologous end-joining DNA ligase [Vicinamibacterales bacterium]|nr:non-homologous end-joining DNA ligase [Vicinamibacterales bacterium]